MHPVLFRIGSVLIPSYGVGTALGVLLALALALHTARMARVDPGKVWNLCILSLFAALVAARLVLIVANWSALRLHPAWLLALAMIHHPLLAGTGAVAGTACAAWFAHHYKLPLAATADALAPPLALGLAFEQTGALLAGSGYGAAADPSVHWAVTYTNPFAAIWSGAPLGIPLHPVQAYAALAFLTLAASLVFLLPRRRQVGDIAGLWFLAAAIIIFLTELWRDPEGRGSLLRGAIDGPQIAAVVMLLIGALMLREHRAIPAPDPPLAANQAPQSAETRGQA